MTQNVFDLSLAQSLYSSNKQFPVDFDDAWQWLEYGTKYDAKVSFKKSGFTEDLDYISSQESSGKPTGGRPIEKILLTVDCFKTWSMMVNTDKGKEVRLYFLECERIATKTLSVNTISQAESTKELIDIASFAIDLVFSNTGIKSELVAGIKLNAIKELAPQVAPQIEAARQLLINSTASEAKLVTVTELGKLLYPPLSAIKTNELLIAKGYQVKNANKKGQKDLTYMPTALGEEYSSKLLATHSPRSPEKYIP